MSDHEVAIGNALPTEGTAHMHQNGHADDDPEHNVGQKQLGRADYYDLMMA